jgi:hypothetical protein
MKWLPKNYHFHKSHLTTNDSGECTLMATLGEDGLVLIWDLKYYEMNNNRGDNTPYNLRPAMRIEINKMDCKSNFFLKILKSILNFNISLFSVK